MFKAVDSASARTMGSCGVSTQIPGQSHFGRVNITEANSLQSEEHPAVNKPSHLITYSMVNPQLLQNLQQWIDMGLPFIRIPFG